MTQMKMPPSTAGFAAGRPLPPELLDGLTDAMMVPPDAPARAVAICQVVEELYASVAWLRPADAADAELASLHHLLEAAQSHQSLVSDGRGRTAPDQ